MKCEMCQRIVSQDEADRASYVYDAGITLCESCAGRQNGSGCLSRLVEEFYKSSPSWPMPRPADLTDDVDNFTSDGDWNRDDVAAAIEAFWADQESADNKAWARANPGFAGTFSDWMSMSSDDRKSYEDGAAGIPTN